MIAQYIKYITSAVPSRAKADLVLPVPEVNLHLLLLQQIEMIVIFAALL